LPYSFNTKLALLSRHSSLAALQQQLAEKVAQFGMDSAQHKLQLDQVCSIFKVFHIIRALIKIHLPHPLHFTRYSAPE
jgi:hypothetical protein